MSRDRLSLTLALLLAGGLVSQARAQEPLPAGQQGAMPAGHPPTSGAAAQGAPARPATPQVLRPPVAPVAAESDEVPVGAIRVIVVDENGRPVADQGVDIGALASGERTRHNGRTGADGIALFTDLPTGTAQHYRVNVPYQGATYSTMPFALTTAHGHSVRVVRHPVTQEDNFVFFHVFRVVVEQRGERMHVIHQGELTNAGTSTYVFPASGRRAALPEEATAFQFQRVITDQRIEEVAGEQAYAIRGSLPPGTVQLAWAYDIPIAGGDLDIPVEIPMRFFNLQMITEALPDLGVTIRGMEPARRLDTQGQSCETSLQTPGCAWVTQLRRGPEDALIRHLTIHLTGIPGPGATRWIALAIAAFFVLLGAVWFITSAGAPPLVEARTRRREDLKAEAEALAEELERGEIGPEYMARRRSEIVRELAELFYADVIEEAAQEHEDERRHEPRRSGPLGYLMPFDGSPSATRTLEFILTFLALPLMLLGLVFFTARPRALRSMKGQAELVISLVLGLAGAALMLMVGTTVLHWDLLLTTGVVSFSGLAFVLRTIVRTSAPRPSSTSST